MADLARNYSVGAYADYLETDNPENISDKEFPQSPLVTPAVEEANWRDLELLAQPKDRVSNYYASRGLTPTTASVSDGMPPTDALTPTWRPGEASDQEAVAMFDRWAAEAKPIDNIEQIIKEGQSLDGLSLQQRAKYRTVLSEATDGLISEESRSEYSLSPELTEANRLFTLAAERTASMKAETTVTEPATVIHEEPCFGEDQGRRPINPPLIAPPALRAEEPNRRVSDLCSALHCLISYIETTHRPWDPPLPPGFEDMKKLLT